MTIWERIAAALAGLTIPVAANTYQAPAGELPDEFAVYFLISDPPAQHADDAETATRYHVQVSVFSRDGLTALPDVKTPMLAAGFTRSASRELPYNLSTGHYGLMWSFYFLEDV